LNPVQEVAASVFAAAFALLRRMGAPPGIFAFHNGYLLIS